MASFNLTQVANKAAQKLMVIDSSGSLSAQQLADAKDIANNLLENWSVQRIYAISAPISVFNLSSGVQKYSIGTGQTFNIARPAAIEAASFQLSFGGGSQSSELKVLTAAEWSSLPDRNSTSTLPKFLYYDRGFPTGFVYLSPVPLGGTLEVTSWGALTQFADLTTPITLQPGYARLLIAGLAIEMAPDYEATPGAALAQDFADAAANIRQLNAELMGPEPPIGLVAPNPNQPVAAGGG